MKDWHYTIIDPSGAVYQIENGIVVARANYKSLSNTPLGWSDISLLWERSTDKYGLTRTFSLPLGFVIEGQSILTFLNWKKNFEQTIYLLINKKTLYLDTDEFYYWYKFFYKGELDFSTYNYDDENAKAQINVMEGGLSKLLNADWDTEYEIPCDQKIINNDGINLHKGIKLTIPAPTTDYPDGIQVSNNVLSEFAVPTATVAIDGEASGVFLQDQIFDPVPNHFTYLANSTNYLLKIQDDFGRPVDINIKGTIKVKCLTELPTGAELELRFLKQDGIAFENGDPNPIGRILRTPTGNFTAGTDYSYDFDIIGTMQPGDELFLIGYLFTVVSGAVEIKIQFTAGTDFGISFATQKIATDNYAIDLLTLYKRIGAKISGSEDDWTSDLLTSRPDILITSGDAVRGIDGAVIKTSMKKFFNSTNVILNCGIGIENEKCVLEEKAHFFQTNNPIYLGQVKQYKDRWAIDAYIFNTLKIGYPDVNLENVNGRFAFNTSYLYSSPIKRVVKQLTLLSDYGADPFEIEITRITGDTTTDSSRDNKNFFIQVTDLIDGKYNLLRQVWVITGVPDPATIYNVGLSVRRLIEVHKNWLSSVFSGFEASFLNFETTQYNKSLVANGLVESAPVSISSLGTPLYKPVYFDFQSPFLPTDDLSMGRITVYNEGAGWIVSEGDPNDTTAPYDGTKDIKSLVNRVTVQSTSPIPFSAFNDLNFKFKLANPVSSVAILRLSFYKGPTLARTVNAAFNRTTTAYQNITVQQSGLIVGDSSILDFDRVTFTLIILPFTTFYLDNVYITIQAQNDLTDIMSVNPNRCFSFIHPNGKLLKGHSIKVGAAPNTEQDQGFLLLATGDTNLEDLII